MLIYPSASASGSPAAGSSGSGGGGAAAAAEGGGGGKRENLPPGLHHHVVPTERAGSLEVYVQVIFVCLRKSAVGRASPALHTFGEIDFAFCEKSLWEVFSPSKKCTSSGNCNDLMEATFKQVFGRVVLCINKKKSPKDLQQGKLIFLWLHLQGFIQRAFLKP